MRNFNPLVSVVIPCYNHEDYVQSAIKSVIDQDYRNIELIVIDDGSSDNSVIKIKEMEKACRERFRKFVFQYRPNKGLCSTLNEALSYCEGEFFAPVASDDILLPEKTSVQVRTYYSLNNNDIVAVFGRVKIFTDDRDRSFRSSGYERNSVKKVYGFEDVLLRKSKTPTPTAMIKTNAIKSLGGYDRSMKIEDFYMWLKLTEGGQSLLFIDQVLALYRRHGGNFSDNSSEMLSGVTEVIYQYRGHSLFGKAIASSYLVHAGDLANSGKFFESIKFFLVGLRYSYKIWTSKLVLIYFYRLCLGAKKMILGRLNG